MKLPSVVTWVILASVAWIACRTPPPAGYGSPCTSDGGCAEGLICLVDFETREAVCTVECDPFREGGPSGCPNPPGERATCEFQCFVWCAVTRDTGDECAFGGCDTENFECPPEN